MHTSHDSLTFWKSDQVIQVSAWSETWIKDGKSHEKPPMEISCLQSLAILAQPQLHPPKIVDTHCSKKTRLPQAKISGKWRLSRLPRNHSSSLHTKQYCRYFVVIIIEVTNKILLSCSSEYNVFLTPKLAHLRIFPGIEMWLHISTAPSVSLAKQGHYVHAARLRSQNRHAALLRSLLFFGRCHYSVMQSGSFQDLKL